MPVRVLFSIFPSPSHLSALLSSVVGFGSLACLLMVTRGLQQLQGSWSISWIKERLSCLPVLKSENFLRNFTAGFFSGLIDQYCVICLLVNQSPSKGINYHDWLCLIRILFLGAREESQHSWSRWSWPILRWSWSSANWEEGWMLERQQIMSATLHFPPGVYSCLDFLLTCCFFLFHEYLLRVSQILDTVLGIGYSS